MIVILTNKMDGHICPLKMGLKTCSKCEEEKDFFDFYMRSDFTYKNICKQCEINSSRNKVLWHCDVCNVDIRKPNKAKHLNTNRHLSCKFFNDKYHYEKLPKQNKRSQEE